MGESIQYSIRCGNCNHSIELKDSECFQIKKFNCPKCSQNLENNYLATFLHKFAEENFGNEIIYHIEDNNLWLDTKNAAKYYGFLNRLGKPDSGKISKLCRDRDKERINNNELKPFGIHDGKGKRWKVLGSELYLYSRTLKKESIGLTTRQAAEKLGISIEEVRKRFSLPRSDPNWINSEKKNPLDKRSHYIVYLNN